MQLYQSSDFTDAADVAQQRIAVLLPDAVVEEIGATSIPGALTKGDVDIFVGVSEASFELSVNVLCSNGFAPKVDTLQTDELRMLESDDKNMDLACQVVVLGSRYDFFREFRDRLIADPSLVEAYNEVKLGHIHLPHKDYRDAKAEFIERVLYSS
ncbi:hypothetical protein BST95_02605 [Halioglobus japonicus]|nr:GrpB family protein [Halioglobus sp. HI00S01]AQA20114.1 hypothetical protein BST95_02605 [Halioglobus japonicus]KZX60248.1 hypothetical protein A3709_13235 [Halioglobus sp. HI00S01]